jgi:hypothetical protein
LIWFGGRRLECRHARRGVAWHRDRRPRRARPAALARAPR